MARYGVGNRQPLDFGFGGTNPPPRDLVALLVVLFTTYSLGQLFPSLVAFLELSPAVWQRGFLWQLVTYAFVPVTSNPFWFLLTMYILWMFGRDVFRVLGRGQFWQMMLWSILSASLVGVALHMLFSMAGASSFQGLVLLAGDEILLTILVAAFATLYPNAVINLFFVLPIRARSFIWLEILIAFIAGFLPTRDLAGFLGICTAVGMTYAMLAGGLRRNLRELRLRVEQRFLEVRLKRMKSKRGMRIVRPDEGGDARRDQKSGKDSQDDDVHRGPWIH